MLRSIFSLLLIPTLAVALLACGDADDTPGTTDTFQLNGAEMRSHLLDVETRIGDGEPYTLTWHYVEAGEGEPIVFLHGLPESWYSWHYQIESLSADYHVIAIDLKGYGQSDKSDGDYHPGTVAEEILILLDAIDVDKFDLVTHDWGTMVGDYLAAAHSDRINHYVRMQAPLLKTDPKNHPQFVLFQDQERAAMMMGNAGAFVPMVYETRIVQPIPETDMARIIEEFGREGVAQAVPRYFRDYFGSSPNVEARQALFAAMTCPVLLLQADSDPAQPLWYFEGGTELFPDATLQLVEESGHFSELEQPEAVTQAIRDFIR